MSPKTCCNAARAASSCACVSQMKCPTRCRSSRCFSVPQCIPQTSPLPFGAQAASELEADFRKQLSLGHKPLCAWRANPSPPSFSQFRPVPSTQLWTEFSQRLSRWRQLATLPPLSPSSLQSMALACKVLGVDLARVIHCVSAASPGAPAAGATALAVGADGTVTVIDDSVVVPIVLTLLGWDVDAMALSAAEVGRVVFVCSCSIARLCV